jgi:hypothetical protein
MSSKDANGEYYSEKTGSREKARAKYKEINGLETWAVNIRKKDKAKIKQLAKDGDMPIHDVISELLHEKGVTI